MVVMLLLGVFSAALSYPLRQIYETYAFNTAVSELKDELSSLKRLSVLHKTEITVTVRYTKDGITLSKACDEAISSKKPYFLQSRRVSGITSLKQDEDQKDTKLLRFHYTQADFPKLRVASQKKHAILTLD